MGPFRLCHESQVPWAPPRWKPAPAAGLRLGVTVPSSGRNDSDFGLCDVTVTVSGFGNFMSIDGAFTTHMDILAKYWIYPCFLSSWCTSSSAQICASSWWWRATHGQSHGEYIASDFRFDSTAGLFDLHICGPDSLEPHRRSEPWLWQGCCTVGPFRLCHRQVPWAPRWKPAPAAGLGLGVTVPSSGRNDSDFGPCDVSGTGNFMSNLKILSVQVVHSPRTWIFLLSIEFARAFYLPGVAPRKYVHGEQLMVKVNTLTSDLTSVQVISPPRWKPAPAAGLGLGVTESRPTVPGLVAGEIMMTRILGRVTCPAPEISCPRSLCIHNAHGYSC